VNNQEIEREVSIPNAIQKMSQTLFDNDGF
jgi:hypothetical protein